MNRAKEARRYAKLAKAAGWSVEETESGFRFLHPNGVDTVGMHKSTSEYRAPKKTRCDFRRLGLRV